MRVLFETSADNIWLTTGDFSVVQKEGNRTVTRTIKHYKLDMILSVGYHIKSIKEM